MMMRIPLTLLLFVFVHGSVTFGQGPAEGIPELQPLAHYIGSWEGEVNSASTPFAKAEQRGSWILGGRYLQQDLQLKSASGETLLEARTLMTYDQTESTYRIWTFTNRGASREATGSWNPETRTMTTTSEGNVKTKTEATFTGTGSEEWTWTATNQSGEEVFRLSGTSSRKAQ